MIPSVNSDSINYWLLNGNYQTVCGLIEDISLQLKEYSLWEVEEEAFNFYRKQIRSKRLLTREEENELILRYKEGDKSAFWKVILRNLGYVIRYARKYQNHGLILNDLISEGNFGLIHACYKFDSSRGFRFSTYAKYYIVNALKAAISSCGFIIRYPSNIEQAMYKLDKKRENIEKSSGYSPSIEELQEALVNVNEKDAWIYEHRRNISISFEGLQEFLGTNIDPMDSFSNLKIVDPEEILEPDDSDLYIQSFRKSVEFILRTLYPIEEDILRRFYGMGCEEQTVEEIGSMFDLTRERVMQIKQKAIRKLRAKEIWIGGKKIAVLDLLRPYL